MSWDLSRRHMFQWCVGIAVLTGIVYAPSLGNAFVALDDGLLILKNPLVQRMSPSTLWRIFTSYDPELYIPLTLLLYQIQYAIAGPNPVIFHFTNLLLHVSNALLVVWVLSMLTQKRWMGVTAGFLFAAHPLHAEAVAWASGTKDVLSSLFFLLSLGFYLRFLSTEGRKDRRRSILFFALGLLSKVVIILLPLVLLLLDHLRGRGIHRQTLREKYPYFALMILFTVVALIGKASNPSTLHAFETVLMACKSTMFHMQKLFLPTKLSVLYPQETAISLARLGFSGALLFAVALLVLWAWSWKRAPRLCLGLGLFLLPLIPSFVNFSKNGYLFVGSDRYAYLPSIGILFIVLILAETWITNRRRAQGSIVAGLMIVALFALSTQVQSRTWQDSEHLYRNTLKYYPQSTMALNNLGSVLIAQEKYDDALALFTEAFALDRGSIAAINIGLVHQQRGEILQAQKWYETAVEKIPTDRALTSADLIPYYFLADLREKMGLPDDALTLYEEATKRGAGFAEPHINLGIAYQKRRQIGKAEEEFRRAIRLDPYLPTPHYHLAGILAETGELREAEQELQKVLRIDPSYENAGRHLKNIQQLMGRS